MAVSIDFLLKDLDPDAVLVDLQTLAAALGLTLPTSPGEPGFQLVDMFATWACNTWNTWALPALRAQFLDDASGDWLTLRAEADGVDRHLEGFATGAITLENRSGQFHDVSAPGAVQVANANGATFTSTGPAAGSAGTLAIWPGGSAPYPTTVLVFAADQAGTGSSTPANSIAGFPLSPSSAPAGVYVVPVHGAMLGTDEESDDLVKVRDRVRPAEESPSSTLAKLTSIVLGTKLPTGQPVSVTRMRVVQTGPAAFTVYLATASGPAAGDTSTPGTDVYEINARVQLLAVPLGAACTVVAASAHTVNLGTITLDVSRESGVTVAEATATASAALDAWSSTLAIGGARKVPSGTGYVFANKVRALVEAPPSVVEVAMGFSDAALGPGDVAELAYTIAVNVVTQS